MSWTDAILITGGLVLGAELGWILWEIVAVFAARRRIAAKVWRPGADRERQT